MRGRNLLGAGEPGQAVAAGVVTQGTEKIAYRIAALNDAAEIVAGFRVDRVGRAAGDARAAGAMSRVGAVFVNGGIFPWGGREFQIGDDAANASRCPLIRSFLV
ncbi:hypothetical protein AGMMS49960_17400 [Betaproteobacteria bacterium]|nr:hypothetical protein AGMMS49543_08160 [Betaproteobacteria bacterium]GHU03293.1 hypothetical protein AGMMS49960_17400 [Betaproteobacteria bacterium]GHU06811.1 hypothetical protein AGMMS50225_02750 [Betaproteobacteria bacterium]GHU18169.1 hypothetical protein AGMMS50243_07700 [Betaproteobacteria bacterium]